MGQAAEKRGDAANAVARLEVEALSTIRGGRRVFSHVSFSVEAGAMAALRGPNGAGKTSLLRVLAGLCPAESGSAGLVTSGGGRFALSAARDGYLERVAYAGHLDALKPSLSVGENLEFWARFLGGGDSETSAARSRAALERFALQDLVSAPAGLCSAGQKRRLGLARLAVIDRPVWLLDEPTVSLDAASVETFGAMVAEHCAAGGIVVAATHIALPVPASVEIDMRDFQRAAQAASEAEGRTGSADDPFLAEGEW